MRSFYVLTTNGDFLVGRPFCAVKTERIYRISWKRFRWIKEAIMLAEIGDMTNGSII